MLSGSHYNNRQQPPKGKPNFTLSPKKRAACPGRPGVGADRPKHLTLGVIAPSVLTLVRKRAPLPDPNRNRNPEPLFQPGADGADHALQFLDLI